MSMKNVLVPTDFSANSWNAIQYALEFFKNSESNFYLLHVSPASSLNEEPIEITAVNVVEKTLVNSPKKNLHQLLKKIKAFSKNPKHNFMILSSYGYFIDAVKSHIAERNIDLIVMGTKGQKAKVDAVIGSNTSDLITKVKCPVLAVPEKAVFKPVKEIGFPTDFNIFYQTKILSTIAEVAQMHDSNIEILHVTKKDEKLTTFQKENRDYLHDFFLDEKHRFHKIANKKIESGVQSFVESQRINLIVMIAKNLNLFQQILFKPTIEEISYHAEIPFLVLHE